MAPHPPAAVVLCAPQRLDAVGARLWQALQAMAGFTCTRSQATCEGLPGEMALWIRVVDAGEVEQAIRELDWVQRQRPRSSALLVVHDADERVLRALAAAGGGDFVDAGASSGELRVRVERLLGRIAPAPLAQALPEVPDLIGRSPAFAEQVARLPIVARYDVGVLLLGETGTGKEVFAQAAHYLSPRSAQPWVAVNCGAIPAELVEDELFGHVRGAYTHAHAARTGLIREAEGGTLFLDEIDALPCSAQVKLLRFLQDRQYRPVGANSLCSADVRVFAASNRELARLAVEGAFRQDLFFRLNTITLRLPPLRERLPDIAPLAQHFLRAAARRWQRPPATLSAAAHAKLMAHGWPGNVRELKNVMERAVMLASGAMLGAEHIDLDNERACAAPAPVATSLRAAKDRLVREFERAYVERVLAESGGNVTHAARVAQKNRRAFFELMRKYRIEPDRYRAGAATPH